MFFYHFFSFFQTPIILSLLDWVLQKYLLVYINIRKIKVNNQESTIFCLLSSAKWFGPRVKSKKWWIVDVPMGNFFYRFCFLRVCLIFKKKHRVNIYTLVTTNNLPLYWTELGTLGFLPKFSKLKKNQRKGNDHRAWFAILTFHLNWIYRYNSKFIQKIFKIFAKKEGKRN